MTSFTKAFAAVCAVFSLFLGSLSAQTLPDNLSITVTIEGQARTMNLAKRSVRAPGFKYYTWTMSGGYVVDTVNAPQVRTYRGTVDGLPNILVMASVRPGNRLYASGFDHNRGRGHIWELSNVDISAQLTGAIPGNANPTRPAGGVAELELGIDINHRQRVEVYGDDPDVAMVVAEHEAAIYDHFMGRDVGVAVAVTTVVSRTGAEPIYTRAFGTHLGDIQREWTNAAAPLTNDVWDQVYSYTPSAGLPNGVGGYAWQNRIGRTDTPDGGGVGSVGVNAMYHETGGHNWDAGHLGYGKDTMGGNRPSHGLFNRPRVLRKRDARILSGDLSVPVGDYPDPVHPFANPDLVTTPVDTAVTIDVLANDNDANGDSLTVVEVTANTEQGGTASIVGNQVFYTPPSGYVGKDVLIYKSRDDSALALETRELVFIEVINGDLTVHYGFEETSGSTTANLTGLGHPGSLVSSDLGSSTEGAPVGRGLRVPAGGVVVDSSRTIPAGQVFTNSNNYFPFCVDDNVYGNYFDPMDQDFAVAMWYRSDDLSQQQNIFRKYWNAELKTGLRVSASAAGVKVELREIEGIYGIRTINSSSTLKEGQWHHVAMVLDRTADTATLYIDGNPEGTVALEAGSHIFHGTKPFLLAEDANGRATIDDFRLWTRTVSEAEIDALVDAAVLPAVNPGPANAAYEVATSSPNLTWDTLETPTAFQVYLGLDRNGVAQAGTGDAEYLGEFTTMDVEAGVLQESRTYYWRVDQVIGGTVFPGTVWSFSTVVDPGTLDTDLFAWWKLDDTSGTVATDSSGNGNHGTVIGPVEWKDGIVGGAAGFNGSTTEVKLDIPNTTWPNYSVSFWALPTTLGQPRWSAMFNNHSNSSDFQVDVNGSNPGQYRLGVEGRSNVDLGEVEAAWIHFTVTCDAEAIRVFKNGDLIHTAAPGGNVWGQLQVGRDRHGNQRFTGCIDDVRVWQRALDRSEIYHVYSVPLPVERRDYYDLASGSLSGLKGDAKYPNSPDDTFLTGGLEIPSELNRDNFGSSLRALLVPEVSGEYTFYVSADDQAELLLSTDERDGNAAVIASVPSFTGQYEWTKFGSQKSVTVTLEAGKSYYIETLFAELGGFEHVAVGWEGPGIELEVIPREVLRRYNDSPVVAPSELASFGFEGGAEGWANESGAARQWVRNSGGTPLPQTGPSGDQTSSETSEGFYFYFDNQLDLLGGGAEARLVSEVIEDAKLRTMGFYYHMYGANIGSLHVDVFDGTSWVNSVWSRSGQQQDSSEADWLLGTVDLSEFSGEIRLRFRAVETGGVFGHIAIDSVELNGFTLPVFEAEVVDLGQLPAGAPIRDDLNFRVSDSDEGDRLTFSKVSGPAWITVGETGLLEGVPPLDELGLKSVVVEATDVFGGKDQMTITFESVNIAPVWAANPQDAGTTQEGLLFSRNIGAFVTDENEGDVLTYSKLGGPSWLSLSSSGVLSGTAGSTDVGTSNVQARVTDSTGASADVVLTVTVEEGLGVYWDAVAGDGLDAGNGDWTDASNRWSANVDGVGGLVAWPGVSYDAIFAPSGASVVTLGDGGQGAIGVQVTGGSVTLAGDPLSLGGRGFAVADGALLTCNNVVELTADQTWTVGSGAVLNVSKIDTNGFTLTILGAGVVNVDDGDRSVSDITEGGNVIYSGTGTLFLRGRQHQSGDLTVTSGLVELTNFVWSSPNFGGGLYVSGTGEVIGDTQTFGFFGRRVELRNGGRLTPKAALYIGTSGTTSILEDARIEGGGSVQLRSVFQVLPSANGSVFDITNQAQIYENVTFDVRDGAAVEDFSMDVTRLASNGTRTVVKTGAGHMRLNTSEASTYTGTFNVNQGSLFFNGTLNNLNTLNVAAGAVFGGDVTMAAGSSVNGILSPGNSVGVIGFGDSLTMNSTSVYRAEVNVSGNDRIDVTGDITITAGASLDLTGSIVDAANAPYVLMTYSGVHSGEFDSVIGLPAGWAVAYDRAAKQITLEPASAVSLVKNFRNEHFTEAELADSALEATLWGHDANPDGDERTNFEELAFGGDPRDGDHFETSVITIAVEDGEGIVKFPRLKSKLLTYTLMVSSDLVMDWEDAEVEGEAVEDGAEAMGDDYEMIRFKQVDALGDHARRFYEVRVSVPE